MAYKGKRNQFKNREEEEFEQKIIDLARVTRVTAGGKRLRFRACVVIGDKKGRVGFGIAKGADVTAAITKAARHAHKNIITVPLINETIPFEIREKFGAAEIILKPTIRGRGIIAGGAVRDILELAGVPNAVSKIFGSKNKINNVKVTFKAIKKIETVLDVKGIKVSSFNFKEGKKETGELEKSKELNKEVDKENKKDNNINSESSKE